MQWDLAGYGSHPIDGDADRVASLASHLTGMTSDIRSQVERIRALDSGDFWESSAGSADSFQEVVEELPEKLDLVATRYENVSSALDTFHPVLANTKQDAEYWIQQAEAAQAEVERAESGIELMEDFDNQAERDAEAANEDREEGTPEVEADQWQGEDYHATLEAAQSDLNTAVANVQSAVSDFESAANNCADAIHDAGSDDLENESGFFAGLSRAWDTYTDILDVVIQVLEVIVMVLAVVALFVPGLNVLVFALTIAIAIGTVLLAMSGKRTWWEAGAAVLNAATLGVGRYLTSATKAAQAGMTAANLAGDAASAAQYASRLQTLSTLTKIKTGYDYAKPFVDIGPDGPSLNIEGGLQNLVLKGVYDPAIGKIPMAQFQNGSWQVIDGGVNFSAIHGALDKSMTLGEMGGDFLASQLRPGGDQSGLTSFEGLDIAVSPGDIQVPEINLPELGPLDIPPMAPIEAPQITVAVDASGGGGSW